MSATPFQFDAATDGITGQTANEISFKSSTTGDTDGIDLLLDQADSGGITFMSPVVEQTVKLADLVGKNRVARVECSGVDMALVIERYPEEVAETQLSLAHGLTELPTELTPYFVKVIQVDGHMAWASPVYVNQS